MRSFGRTVGMVALFLGLFCLPAAGLQPVASPITAPTGISFDPLVDYERLVLTVAGPDGLYLRHEFEAGKTPSLALVDEAGNALPDGGYNYELTVTPRLSPELGQALEAIRVSGDEIAREDLDRSGLLSEPLVQTGFFRVRGGTLVLTQDQEEPTAPLEPRRLTGSGLQSAQEGLTNVSAADQVILDDLIVDGSLCVGFDCVNGESFGFDTIRLKENNLRIKFQDTSNSGSFPSNDWQITANDSASGGANKFSIDDIDGGRTPFTIEASAPSNSLYVDDGGRVGFGTSVPVVDLHAVSGNTPTLRLEQNGSSGFTPQTWDVAGNETNFFIRDVTNGSKLPFRIRPNAPTSSIDVATNGDVGFGTGSPSTPLHVLRTTAGGKDMLTMTNNGAVRFIMEDTSRDTWTIRNVSDGGTNSAFFINTVPTPGAGAQFEIEEDGDIFVNGAMVHTSSRLAKTSFDLPNPLEVLSRVLEMEIPTWIYKRDNDADRHIGPVAEDFFALFGFGPDDKHIAPSDTAGVALAAIQGLNQKLEDKDQVISDLKARVAELEALVGKLVGVQE